MEFKFILGIDMSKEFFNYCLMNLDFEILEEDQIDNSQLAIQSFINDLLDRRKGLKMSDLFLLMEHTGIYVQHLAKTWLANQGRLSIIPATKVSEQLGGSFGFSEKTDQLDARRLAEYGIRYTDQLQQWKAKNKTLELLQHLHRQRSRFMDVINILEVPVNESKKFDSPEIYEQLKQKQAKSIETLKADLKEIENQLKQIIEQDPDLQDLFKLITSVNGVGPVTAREIIIATEAFNKFTPEQAKSFARYSGVVPLKKQSGKMKKRARTSKRANKKIKVVLTMGATSLVGSLTDLGLYYERKIKEGKPHFSVINAMRNKLILRIFAVVRNGVIYDENYNFS